MPDQDLAWRVEEACLNAWPSPAHVLVDGYLLRAAGGPSRRLNSVNPLRGAGAPEPAVAACERIYADLGRRAIFRVPGLAPDMDPVLDRRGYAVEAESCTLSRDLDAWPMEPDPGVRLAGAPSEAWLAARDAVNGAGTADAFRATVAALALPRAFAAVGAEGEAVAFGVLDRSLVVVESVAVPVASRGRGLARRAVAALLRWGRGGGATGACLQVQADNAPARALYARLGFGELHRYHYRVRPGRG